MMTLIEGPKNSVSTPPKRRRRRTGELGLTAAVVALVATATSLWAPRDAAGQDLRLHVEPAVGLWVDTPQSDRFGPGVYAAVRPSVTLGPVVAFQLGYSLIWAPPGDGFEDDGTAHLITGGLRVRPFGTLRAPETQLGGLFIDTNAGYVRTGDLDRSVIDVGVGYGFQAGANFSLGPVVRYTHIFQPGGSATLDENDGQLLSLGLSLSFGPAPDAPPAPPEPPAVVECPPAPEVPECVQAVCAPPPEAVACVCVDTDGDGVCDLDDRCPTLSGPAATQGCPIDPCTGRPIVVVVQFRFDSSAMPEQRTGAVQTMDPVLDAVAAAIAKDPTCRVCIIGHASEEGAREHNQTLSTQRATEVQFYMVGRGLEKRRIPALGVGSRCPLVPENSRLANRRVEFRRLLEGDTCPSDCSPPVDSR